MTDKQRPLAGKVALVTGAGQGVGQGIALALASEGVSVAVLGRTLDKLETTCDLLRQRGVEAEPIQCNIVELESIPAVVDQVVDRFGRLDIVVNNAWFGINGPLLDISDRDFQKGYWTGPFASFAFMKAAHPHLKASGDGNIINLVTSAMVRWDSATYGAYGSAKAAVRALSRTAAVEWARDGIRVNSIAPHALSPGLKWWTENNPEEAEAFIASIPMGRIGDIEDDIGRAVVALVGPDMKYLTGATIPLDGGQAFFG